MLSEIQATLANEHNSGQNKTFSSVFLLSVLLGDDREKRPKCGPQRRRSKATSLVQQSKTITIPVKEDVVWTKNVRNLTERESLSSSLCQKWSFMLHEHVINA